MKTALTKLLGIDYPVMLAGMGGVSYSKLVAAVSQAGGIGTLGASTMGKETMIQEIESVKKMTNKPFGVDLLTAMPGDITELVKVVIDLGAKLFVAGLGVPEKVVSLCHDNGVIVANMCGKVSHAVRAVEAGCDLVIAQGTEAGGHTGLVATMPLVPQIVDAVKNVPVVAAGGIVDGRGLAASLCLGACGVWVGTRFIATPEARAVPHYKDRILSVKEDGTTISRAYSGKTMRVIKNSYTDYFEINLQELQPFPNQLGRSVADNAFHLGGDENTPNIDPDKECMPAGQGAGAINELIPAGELVKRFVEDANDILISLGGALWREENQVNVT